MVEDQVGLKLGQEPCDIVFDGILIDSRWNIQEIPITNDNYIISNRE